MKVKQKYPGHIDKLSSRDQNKHFSNITHGGKGSCPREFNKHGENAYRTNSYWNNCEFERKKQARLDYATAHAS